MRLDRIINGDPTHGVEPILPVSKTTFYAGIRDGRFPAPISLPGVRGSFWRAADIYAVIHAATMAGGQA